MAEETAIADRLHSAAIHLLRRVRRVDESSGLSAAKLSALSVVVFAGPISLGDLAAAEQVRPPSMTRLVKELETEGLVTREFDESDRRVARIRATADGQRLMKKGRNARVELISQWLRDLTPEDRAKLDQATRILERILSLPIRDRTS
jgi:DNA-binding MarR family transcriptional regulator